MLNIFHIGYRPVKNISKFSLVYLIFCFCKLVYLLYLSAAGPSGNVRRFVKTKLRRELDYGCDSGGWSRHLEKSNLTYQSLLSLVLTLTTVCSLSWKSYLIYILVQYITIIYILVHLYTCAAQIFTESRKSKNSRRTNLSVCVLENDTLQAYRLLFTAWETE